MFIIMHLFILFYKMYLIWLIIFLICVFCFFVSFLCFFIRFEIINDSVAKLHKTQGDYAMGDTLNEELFKQLETNDIRVSSVCLKSLFSDLAKKKKKNAIQHCFCSCSGEIIGDAKWKKLMDALTVNRTVNRLDFQRKLMFCCCRCWLLCSHFS